MNDFGEFGNFMESFLNNNNSIIEKLEKIKEELNKKLEKNYKEEKRDGIDEGISMIDDLIFHIKVRI